MRSNTIRESYSIKASIPDKSRSSIHFMTVMIQFYLSLISRYSLCPLSEQKCHEVFALHSSLFITIGSMAFFQFAYLRTLSMGTFTRVMMNVIWGAAAHSLLLLFKKYPMSNVLDRNYSIQAFFIKVFVGYVFADVMYYSIHRVLHWKYGVSDQAEQAELG